MTTQPKTLDDLKLWLARTTGGSAEDVDRIIQNVSAVAIVRYRQHEAEQAPRQPPPSPPQIGVTMETVKAYVDGRLEGITLSGHAHGADVPSTGEMA